ncbi:MAG: hypothetical protein COB73_04330 [Flavobacteriaceae bacterium]|nr:MAG: hypothetical protein COB73_04330 [Flavobacteriaceae bacterium]
MKIFIPENLDIDILIHNNPPEFKKRKFKRDELLYIIHLVSAISQTNKDLLFEDFVPINAQMLQNLFKNYKEYLGYLIIDLKIVESDNQYIVGVRSKGYRFTKKYRTTVNPIAIIDKRFKKKLQRHKLKKEQSVKHLDHLTKWFNPKLKIDKEAVHDFLKEEYETKQGDYDLWDYDRIKKMHKKPLHQYNHAKMSVDKLSWQDFNLMLDNNVYRFHSNLTNMRSVVRNAITYDGEKLISIDIKNSQPYLSTVLLSRAFWIEENKHASSLSLTFFDPKKRPIKGFNHIINDLSSNVSNTNTTVTYIMLGDCPQPITSKGLQHYIDLVVNGGFYEYLGKQFTKELGIGFRDRKEVKAAVFQVLFTSNQFIGQEAAKPKKIFKKLFKQVYDVFAQIKKRDKSILPRLLQSIESYLMIDVIAKRISIEYPEAPIFTIHDSITTTEEYVDVVEQIMLEELAKAIGHSPELKREDWDIKNLTKHLDTLKQKSKKVA